MRLLQFATGMLLVALAAIAAGTASNPLSAPTPVLALDPNVGIVYVEVDDQPPVDNGGYSWYEPEWANEWDDTVDLPHEDSISPNFEGYYRILFDLEYVPDQLELWFSSDDGITVWVNGESLGHHGATEGSSTGGCVNRPPQCSNTNTVVPPVDITDDLVEGTNLIAAVVNNTPAGENASYFNIEFPPGQYDPFDEVEDPNFPQDLYGDPVDVATGSFIHSHTDVSIPTAGLPLEFSRSYNSRSDAERAMGPGWTHNFDFYLEDRGDDVAVHYPDGHAILFLLDNGDLVPRAGVYDTLVENVDDSFTFTTRRLIEYEFSSAGDLDLVRDRNGNTLDLEYTGGAANICRRTARWKRTQSHLRSGPGRHGRGPSGRDLNEDGGLQLHKRRSG